MLTRREFVAATSGLLLAGSSLARADATELPRLLFIGLRGGLDGLATVVPVGDPDYSSARGAHAMRRQDLLPLDDFFSLHPAMKTCHAMFRRGELAIHHAVGVEDADTSSHFDAWHGLYESGWLNDLAQSSGVRLDRSAPRACTASDFETKMKMLASQWASGAKPRVSAIEFGGWDMHAGQGGLTGLLADRLRVLDRGLENFKDRLPADIWKKTLVIVASEFGRSVRVNAAGGTDHGAGGVVFAFGGAIDGGFVKADWPGLRADASQDGGLRATRNVHVVLNELMEAKFPSGRIFT